MKNYDTAAAVACLGGVFLDILKGGDIGLSGFEREAVLVGHMTIAAAAALALESYDDELCASLPAGSRIHERRPRTLATTFGDLAFARRVCVDRYGNTFAPLDDAIDLARNARVSPHAQEFLVDAASEGSYAKAAHFMEAAGGSSVSARTVMNVMRLAGGACEEADVALAHDLYANGVLPEADADDEEICMEADGCWIPLQDGGNVEVKAMVAYAGKAGPGRVERVRPVRFGCVSGPRAFWAQGMAATATRFDMSKVRVCHAGFDGEAWCKQAADYLPAAASVDGNLDPFHVNRAIGSCFAEPGADAERQVMQCIWFGRAGDAADLLEALADDGLARPKNAAQVAAYLRNNAEFIRSCPPSLGTMEAENEHLYASRMKSVPCGWSRRGASDMARIRSRKYSGREVPMPTRDSRMSPTRRRARQKKVDDFLTRAAGRPVECVGSGYEYPHRASTAGMRADIRYKAGLTADHMVGEV